MLTSEQLFKVVAQMDALLGDQQEQIEEMAKDIELLKLALTRAENTIEDMTK